MRLPHTAMSAATVLTCVTIAIHISNSDVCMSTRCAATQGDLLQTQAMPFVHSSYLPCSYPRQRVSAYQALAWYAPSQLSYTGLNKSVTVGTPVTSRSYKGSNIALMIELLAGPLVGGAVQDKLASKNWGNLMIALNPSTLGDPSSIMHNVQLMLGRVKGARKAAGVKEIMLPGERGDRLAGTCKGVSASYNFLHDIPCYFTFYSINCKQTTVNHQASKDNGTCDSTHATAICVVMHASLHSDA